MAAIVVAAEIARTDGEGKSVAKNGFIPIIKSGQQVDEEGVAALTLTSADMQN